MAAQDLQLTFHPLTPDRWNDFEALFGPRGACAGCWCMFWKLPQKNFIALAGDGTHKQQQLLVESGVTPGLLAYLNLALAAGDTMQLREHRRGDADPAPDQLRLVRGRAAQCLSATGALARAQARG